RRCDALRTGSGRRVSFRGWWRAATALDSDPGPAGAARRTAKAPASAPRDPCYCPHLRARVPPARPPFLDQRPRGRGAVTRVLVLIPCYNEEQSIGWVIQEVREKLGDVPILVVDDCSTDST